MQEKIARLKEEQQKRFQEELSLHGISLDDEVYDQCHTYRGIFN